MVALVPSNTRDLVLIPAEVIFVARKLTQPVGSMIISVTLVPGRSKISFEWKVNSYTTVTFKCYARGFCVTCFRDNRVQ